MQRFLDLADFSRDQVLDLIGLAGRLQARPEPQALAGRILGLLFMNPSLRTLSSFQAGMMRLGGTSFVVTPGQGTWNVETRDGTVMNAGAAEHVREAIPVLASYCVYVRERRAPFRVDDSGADERVNGHPKRDSIRAYCGVPLIDRSGRMFGTVCHFDPQPRTISDRSVALMQALAPLLQRYFAGASRNDSGISTRDFHAASSWAAPSNTRERQSPPAR